MRCPSRLLALCAPFAAALCLSACGAGPIPWPPPPAPGAASAAPGTGDAAATVASSAPAAPLPAANHHDPASLDPALATERAPDVLRVRFMTTKGPFVVEAHRDWAPNGADRFYNLVKLGFFDDTRFFRVIEGFMVQFGIPGDPSVASKWRVSNIPDDPVVRSNKRGFVTFAQTGAPHSRSTQIFINYADNSRLDATRFAPFAQVVEGMSVVEALYRGYGEGKPSGEGPDQSRIQEEGNPYLDAQFPKLDGILSTTIL